MKEQRNKYKPLVHPNIIGPTEVKQLYTLMDQIRNDKIKHDQAEVDRLHKLYKTGPYNESYDPVKLKAALKSMEANHSHQYRITKPKKLPGQGIGGGKKQKEAERQKLILELENG